MKKKKKVMFIASTGGHLSELMQLAPLFKKYDYNIVTEKTKSNLNLIKKYPNRVHYIISGTYTNFKAKLIYPFKLLLNCFISLLYDCNVLSDNFLSFSKNSKKSFNCFSIIIPLSDFKIIYLHKLYMLYQTFDKL